MQIYGVPLDGEYLAYPVIKVTDKNVAGIVELVHGNRYINAYDLATKMRTLWCIGAKYVLQVVADKQNQKCVMCHKLQEILAKTSHFSFHFLLSLKLKLALMMKFDDIIINEYSQDAVTVPLSVKVQTVQGGAFEERRHKRLEREGGLYSLHYGIRRYTFIQCSSSHLVSLQW
jgi:hypothetical protein